MQGTDASKHKRSPLHGKHHGSAKTLFRGLGLPARDQDSPSGWMGVLKHDCSVSDSNVMVHYGAPTAPFLHPSTCYVHQMTDNLHKYQYLWDGSQPGWSLAHVDHVVWTLIVRFPEGGPVLKQIITKSHRST